ncbi:TPA: SDR family NAD(P)-dependent oxidoreductase, partial [Burkholderia cepacia]|nr:SDR family NAD(P)-dependent oxidoreductase [Burkholderia cepacia]
HLTFGLLEGWWLAEDGALRMAGTPALAPERWRQVLEAEGFIGIEMPAEATHRLGQQIVVAMSDGVVRLEQESAALALAQPIAAPVRIRAATASGQRQASVREAIRESLAQVLKMTDVQFEDDEAFSSYGVDSITGVTLINVINTRLGLSLLTTVLFDYPSIGQLGAHISAKHDELADVVAQAVIPIAVTQTALQVTGVSRGGKDRRRRGGSGLGTVPIALPVERVIANGPIYHRVKLERPGSIDDLRVVEDRLASLGPAEVRIAVRAFSLNFGDLLCVKGLYPTQPPYPFTPGFEASGVVVSVGSNVSRVAIGDAVVALAGETLGAHASVLTCAESQVFVRPAGLSFEAACAVPIVALTMIECFAKAQLKPGERILIQTAAGGTGLMAVQLAQHAGAEIYATAGSQEKLDYLASLGVPHRVNYREEDFEAAIGRLTDGQGVDVVINTLEGEAVQKGLNCLAPGGRYIEIAMTALKSACAIDLSGLSDNQTLYSVDLRKLIRTQPAALQRAVHEMARLLEDGVISPTLGRTFELGQIQDAYRWLEDRRNIGKVVVSVPEAYRFKAREINESATSLEPIAVIGMSGRFACTDNVRELWAALAKGQDLIEDVTRWDLSQHYRQSCEPYCRHGGFLRDIDCFDPLFFNLSGVEASVIDPQQRLFLQESWRALEDAGYAGAGIEGRRCGVYVGCAMGDYQRLLDETAPAQAFWGNAGSVIPARIAYHLDLQGPAVAIDTACSSSLVAIHQACQGLRAGEADLAIAGGVFVQSTEAFYLQANRAGMLSPTGRCHTFDAQADGFVPGEGVGAIVLKRLSQAIADGDHIDGVIRGTGMNQDGATNGITAPSARSQTRLEREVYQRYGIDSGAIGLVEAHGTGTVLGDPIEFQALTETFGQDDTRKTRCAIGSIKSNLGHTATAAGIAGVIKVLLALQHRQIPPSLHFTKGNPHLDFEHSPFYVPTRLEAWEKQADGERLAAVSSFGFSGTNAHAVIGEAPPIAAMMPQRPAYLIVLSARTPAQLREQVEQLRAHIEREAVDMNAMSQTLLIGRRHFDHRLACVTTNLGALLTQLAQWLERGTIPDGMSGHIRPMKDELVGLIRFGQQSLAESAGALTREALQGPLLALAELYVQGVGLDWGCLFEGQVRRRISLPTYPFAKERYWASKNSNAALTGPANQTTFVDVKQSERACIPTAPDVVLEPSDMVALPSTKVLEDLSSFEAQLAPLLRVQLDARGWLAEDASPAEPYVRWREHSIWLLEKRGLLSQVAPDPAAQWAHWDAYREAVRDEPALRARVRLVDTTLRALPAVLRGERAATEVLFPNGQFELVEGVYHGHATADYYNAVLAERLMAYVRARLQADPQARLRILEIGAGTGGTSTTLFAHLAPYASQIDEYAYTDLSQAFLLHARQQYVERAPYLKTQRLDIERAPQEQGFEPGCYDVVVAANVLHATRDIHRTIRHTKALLKGNGLLLLNELTDMGLFGHLTFGLLEGWWLAEDRELRIKGTPSLTPETWRQVLEREGFQSVQFPAMAGHGAGQQIVVAVSDGVMPKNVKAMSQPATTIENISEPSVRETVLLAVGWTAQALEISSEVPPAYAVHGIVLCEVDTDMNELAPALPAAQCMRLTATGQLVERYESYAQQLLTWIQREVAAHPSEPLLLQLVIPNDGEGAVLQGLGGLLRSAQEEYPLLAAQVVAVEDNVSASVLAHRLEAEAVAPQQMVRYGQAAREVWGLAALNAEPSVTSLPWRSDGVYLITGGLGGLGQIFARAIAQVGNPTLVLIGRSVLVPAQVGTLETLRAAGAQIECRTVDVSDAAAVSTLVADIVAQYGQLNGIIHSAGVLRDGMLAMKTEQALHEVFAPKVAGLVALDEATREVALDWLVACSSIAGVLGSAGLADYAAANSFMDAYASYRNGLIEQGLRRGRTLSVSWSLWAHGGMQVSATGWERMQRLTGWDMRPMSNEAGVSALVEALGRSAPQMLVAYADRTRVMEGLHVVGAAPKARRNVLINSMGCIPGQGYRAELKGLSLAQCVQWDLLEQTHLLTQVPRSQLELETNLREFGFDSIMFAQLAMRLSTHYGIDFTPSLFFSYASLAQFAGYLVDTYGSALEQFYQADKTISPLVPDQVTRLVFRPANDEPLPTAGTRVDEPIAIIGVSGRFPGARTVDELWKILRNGHEVVQEIPPERFDWRLCYGDPQQAPNKTPGKWLGVMPGVDEFDPSFFEISPREAELMDPRQRLLLQESWRALEDAGYGSSHLKRHTIGMFVGVERGDYHSLLGAQDTLTSNHEGILASRLAYVLNLRGPVMAINTACSSGLVAAHQACQSLRTGECDTAIAAGVSLILTPTFLIQMGQAGMLSPEGKCYAFDRRANGMVPGEAVVAVVLKRLSQAQVDGDPIQAVITASGINYDGKTDGITAPSGAAQVRLLQTVYDRFQIDPNELDYIVTHGTGTRLGDPIEINALVDAFGRYTQRRKYCALTSTKTNLGHTMAASGLVSLVSLVQAMHHATIPASQNCIEESDYIRWETSPFYVNKVATPWPVYADRPRRGAVSAFGASGTNAHIVVQSYAAGTLDADALDAPPYHLLALSAKTDEALRARIDDLLTVLQAQHWDGAALRAMSYTLLTGRQHFAHRCAVVIQDRGDAVYVLQQALGSETRVNLFAGHVGRQFEAQKALLGYGQTLIEQVATSPIDHTVVQEAMYALADMYCQGYALPWERLYGDARPRRISLPTYPFAKERYWVPQSNSRETSDTTIRAKLHPLVHRNSSTLNEQRYSTMVTGDEWFVRDHVVAGQPVVPGVVQLEWARAAVALASGLAVDHAVVLQDVTWLRPLTVSGPLEVHIGMIVDDDGQVRYEIYSGNDDGSDDGAARYSQGRAQVQTSAGDEAPRIDLVELRACCDRTVTGAECYARFGQIGLVYGPSFQALKTLQVGEGLAIGGLKQPMSPDGYGLPAALLDGALQASVGLATEALGLALPFAVQEVRQWGAVPDEVWAVVRPGIHDSVAVRKLDIDIADAEGRVVVRLSGFSSRVLESQSALQTMLLTPHWVAQPQPTGQLRTWDSHHVVICELDQPTGLEDALAPVRCIRLMAEQGTLAQRYAWYAQQLLTHVRQVVAGPSGVPVLLQLVVPASGEGIVLKGLGGLLRSAQQEYPQLVVQTVAVEDATELASHLRAEAGAPTPQVRYGHLGREVLVFTEHGPVEASLPWRDGGVYWITGGLGGLGQILARAIAQVRNAVLVLSGRSPLKPEQEVALDALRVQGAQVEYQPVDVSDPVAVAALVQDVVGRHGQLNGVIHGAGVLHDSLLMNKTLDELRQVLAPKVAGLVALDEATRDIALDWLVLCSSVAGVWGNVGQADYAAANGFMDAYAQYRETRVAKGQRQGRTVAVNWPLWAGGGMQVDAGTQVRLGRLMGLQALPDEAGVAALIQALAQPMAQVMVLHGERQRMWQFVQRAEAVPVQSGPSLDSLNASQDGELATQVERALTELVSVHLKIGREELDRDTPLSEFGFDSIALTSFSHTLNARYGLRLSPTVFFEAPTIAALATYLVREHRTELATAFSVTDVARQHDISVPASAAMPTRRRARRAARVTVLTQSTSSTLEPIAVIGMSGCFPQAEDIEALWVNLVAGRDCISELPVGRWGADAVPAIRHAGVLDGVDEFDPLFFSISPREAQGMDPQQRLLMTYVYKVIEDAGYSVQSLSGSNTALLVGTSTSGYGQMLARSGEVVAGSSAAGLVGSMGPNRMSYWLNWHGPSEPVETSCSSSLVAVHRAVTLLRSGQCEQAVVGGINTLLASEAHDSLTLAGMLSPEGRCRTFSAQANGYVRGEGVGMLMLKPLSAAERDGDHIYGLIVGSAQNHGGRASSLTAPNPVAQAQLVETAFRQAGVDPRTVGYIEAHGTGTALGDPIEIQGLKRAFLALTGEDALSTGQIGLGTIKSNLGHLELAAGVAGLIKVLLQMRHGQLVKSLNSEPLNPQIELEGSPFYVVNENRPWESPKDQEGKLLPRRAGVSSFGFGGVNAHAVLEEYISPVQNVERVQMTGPVLVVLSARNEAQLKMQVEQLQAHLDKHEVNLTELAYTLQVGREAMAVRLALVVDTLERLRERLSAYVRGEAGLADTYQGEVGREQGILAVFRADEELHDAISKWIARGKVGKLAELWVQGLGVDWSQLYGELKPKRISLPTYPFARERYWVPQGSTQETSRTTLQARLHPLVHRNTSDLDGQRYSTTLMGDEDFLRDHVVDGERVLPGVVHLEWARAAVTLASGLDTGQTVALQDVTWLRPLRVREPLEVHIGLEVRDDGQIGFEIYSGDGDEVVVYSQGRAEVVVAGEAPQVDLDRLRGQCDQVLSGEVCYARFRQLGLHYGSGLRVLQEVRTGAQLVVGSLRLANGAADYEWVPGLLDGALQVSVGLAWDGPHALSLPFVLTRVQQWGVLPSEAWSVVRPSADDTATVRKLDIDIVNAGGQVAMRLAGFCTQSRQGVVSSKAVPAFAPDVVLASNTEIALPKVTAHDLAMVDAHLGPLLRMQLDAVGWLADDARPAESYMRWREHSLRLLEERGLLSQDQPDQEVLWAQWDAYRETVQNDPTLRAQVRLVDATLRALPAVLRGDMPITEVMFPEGQMDLMEDVYRGHPVADYFNAVLAEQLVAYVQARLRVNSQTRLRILEVGAGTGGTSAMLFAHLAPYALQIDEYTYTDLSQAFLLHAQTHYAEQTPYLNTRRLDIERAPLDQGFEPGHYDVVVAANVLHATRDIHRTVRHAKALLKHNGLLLLNELTSIGLLAHVAVGLLEGWWLAEDRELRIAGTPALASETWQQVLEHEGFRSVQFPALAGHELGQQIVLAFSDGVVPTDPVSTSSRVRPTALVEALAQVDIRLLDRATDAIKTSGRSVDVAIPDLDSIQTAQRYVTQLLARTLQLSPQNIDAYVPLEQYGIDSLMVSALTSDLEKVFGPLSKTLFFEYQTIAALTQYFLREHGTRIFALIEHDGLGLSLQTQESGRSSVKAHSIVARYPRRRLPGRLKESSTAGQGQGALDIAIVGLSGRYPRANTVDGYWNNLVQGMDCITEIPSERWDWHETFDPQKGLPGKSYCKWGGFIDGVDEFDPLFFGISPREAECIDPQERLFLQCAYHAIEDAGYTRENLSARATLMEPGGPVGVFVGVTYGEYNLYGAQALANGEEFGAWSSFASIANRVSYYCNFHGPSLAVDTMCSSSLTAIHLACQSIRNGNCDVAIAGAVNVTLHPNKYLMLAQRQFVSDDGRCNAFGARANGFVPSEGVGAVVLKPLAHAIVDGDHIYGVIKGSVVNHGGKTNGYTVPNPNAHAELIGHALTEAGVHPRAISYVEAHGTGTVLGDPIEITGLSKAYGALTQDRQYCSIGSAKSNVGHCESAAGMAGLTKVLLQMQHGQLVKSLHSEELNPNIDFTKTPFIVQQTLCAWSRPVLNLDGREREYPRTAGLSAFGAGGANSHLIIEEYVEPQRMPTPVNGPMLVVLSARSEERLKAQVEQLVAYLDTHEVELTDLAYTLQVGREALAVRLALVVDTLERLRERLLAYARGEVGLVDTYQGEVRREQGALAVFRADEDLQKAIEAWTAKGKLAKLAELWVQGLEVDWSQLYGENRPKRISLPTYPFAKERYWVPERGKQTPGAGIGQAQLHPLLHRNSSTLDEQRYSTMLTGDEWFVRDHVLVGQPVVPGVVQLEWARAAVALASGLPAEQAVVLQDVTWLRPLTVSAPLEVHIGLTVEDDGRVGYEIYSNQADGSGGDEAVVYSQGWAQVEAEEGDDAPRIDLAGLRASCERTVAGAECYARFAQLRLVCGPSLRVLNVLQVGNGLAIGALRRLTSQDGYGLPPALLDGALQASVGLATEDAGLGLPFAVQEVKQWG